MSQSDKEKNSEKLPQDSKQSHTASSVDLTFEADMRKAIALSQRQAAESADRKQKDDKKMPAAAEPPETSVYDAELFALYTEKAKKRSLMPEGYNASSSSSSSSSSSASSSTALSLPKIKTDLDAEDFLEKAVQSVNKFLVQLNTLDSNPTEDLRTVQEEVDTTTFIVSSSVKKAKLDPLFDEYYRAVKKGLYELLKEQYYQIRQDFLKIPNSLIEERYVIQKIQLSEVTKEKLKLLSEYAKRSPVDEREVPRKCLEAINKSIQDIDSTLQYLKRTFPETVETYYTSLNDKKLASTSTQLIPLAMQVTPGQENAEDSDGEEIDEDTLAAMKLSEDLVRGGAADEETEEETDEDENLIKVAKSLSLKPPQSPSPTGGSQQFFNSGPSPRATSVPTSPAATTPETTAQEKESGSRMGIGMSRGEEGNP